MLLHLVALDKFIFIFITKTVNTNNLDGVNMEIINEKHSILENHQQEDSIFNQIDELVNKNELDEAILLIDLIPESSPNFGKALFIKSMILGFLGKDTESVEKLKDSINVQFGDKSDLFDLNNPEDLFDFGITNFYFGDYHKAIECFDMSLGILPEQSEVIYYKALSFGCLGEFRKAIDVIDEAIKLNPENSSYWNDKGAFLSELNRVAAAHKCFNKSIQLNQDSYNWSNKAVLYHKCNDLQQALECYGNAMKLDSEDIYPVIGKAKIYMELNDFDKAEDYFDLADEIDSTDLEYLTERGKYMMFVEDYKKAVRYFDKCLRYNDKLAFVWMFKSMALKELNHDYEAELCVDRAIEIDPEILSKFDEFF